MAPPALSGPRIATSAPWLSAVACRKPILGEGEGISFCASCIQEMAGKPATPAKAEEGIRNQNIDRFITGEIVMKER